MYAQLVLEVGPERAVEVAQALGVTADQRPDPSLVLGTGEVSVLDMASTYSTFAREGERIDPYLIVEVTDADGEVVFAAEETRVERAIDAGTARAVTHALRGVIEDGTGTGARLDRPAAGKTGTTQDNVDAWFAGYTPTYTAAVWMGYPEGSRPMDDVRGAPVTGGSLPPTSGSASWTRPSSTWSPPTSPLRPMSCCSPRRIPTSASPSPPTGVPSGPR